MTPAWVERRVDRPGEPGYGQRPRSRGVDHVLGFDRLFGGDDAGDSSATDIDRADTRAIAHARAGGARRSQITHKQRMYVHHPVRRTPHGAVELRAFERRDESARALARPALHFHAQ